jgi:hypothetical protein
VIKAVNESPIYFSRVSTLQEKQKIQEILDNFHKRGCGWGQVPQGVKRGPQGAMLKPGHPKPAVL